jgi:hypothetical protein
MKLLFHKLDYYGRWFEDDENPEGFTEKVPPDTGHVFDEELNGWVPKPPPEASLTEPEPGEQTEPEPGGETARHEEEPAEAEFHPETEASPEAEPEIEEEITEQEEQTGSGQETTGQE